MAPVVPDTKSRVLVTGANSFIGHHIIKLLLEKTPHQIEATISNSNASSQLQVIHGSHPRLTMHVVPDITKSEAFVRPAQHCHAIIHLATPSIASSDNYEEDLLLPTLQGVQAICHAANVNQSTKRLVYCSSFAAVFNPAPEGSSPEKIYTEEDWNPTTYDQAKGAPDMLLAYQGSKALAEKEVHRLCSEQNRWDMISLCPGLVLGAPVEGSVGSEDDLKQSNAVIWELFDKEEVPPTTIPSKCFNLNQHFAELISPPVWTSVVSLAEAHISALSAPGVGIQRFLLINGTFENQELCDMIRAADSHLDQRSKDRVPQGTPGHRGKLWKANGDKAAEYLHFSKPTLRNTVSSLRAYLFQMEGSRQKAS